MATAAQALFEELKPVLGIEADVKISQTQDGIGIVAAKEIYSDEVFFRVPSENCIIFDILDNAISLPTDQTGPMVAKMMEMMKEKLQPWDFVLSFAVMDALEGHYGKPWHDLTQLVLSEPQEEAHPYLLPPDLLEELGDPVLAQEGREQRERLEQAFPDLMAEPSPGELPLFLRVFGYVNSHTYCVGGRYYSLVPFMGFANHSNIPNTLFTSDDDTRAIVLADFYPMREGERVTVNYFGEFEATNQRFMMQYGFVPVGNVGERLDYDDLQSDALLSPKRLEVILDELIEYRPGFSADPYYYAAVNSFPYDEDVEDGEEGHLETAAECLKMSESWMEAIPSTAEADEAELSSLLSTTPGSRRGAVLRYRIERRRTIEAAIKTLRAYLEEQ